ncbi:hypothetical protein C0J52_24919 [Blattella germanica]|nr:hypothetical protein C0J52_24919 [Blattella germanica]
MITSRRGMTDGAEGGRRHAFHEGLCVLEIGMWKLQCTRSVVGDCADCVTQPPGSLGKMGVLFEENVKKLNRDACPASFASASAVTGLIALDDARKAADKCQQQQESLSAQLQVMSLISMRKISRCC